MEGQRKKKLICSKGSCTKRIMGLNRISRRSFLLATVAFGLVTACDATQSSQQEVSSDGIPKRFVALEWVLVEDLLALGIQPVGVTYLGGFDILSALKPS